MGPTSNNDILLHKLLICNVQMWATTRYIILTLTVCMDITDTNNQPSIYKDTSISIHIFVYVYTGIDVWELMC